MTDSFWDHVEDEPVMDLESLPEAEGESTIAKFRSIVTSHTLACVNDVPVDVFTAQAVVTVYDAISPENQRHFMAMPTPRIADIAWKTLAKGMETKGEPNVHVEQRR